MNIKNITIVTIMVTNIVILPMPGHHKFAWRRCYKIGKRVVLTFLNHKKEKVLEKYLKNLVKWNAIVVKMNDVMFFQKYFEIFKNGHL